MDDDTDPHPATGRPRTRRPLLVQTTDGVGPLAVEEDLDPRNWGSAEPNRQSPEAPREQRRSRCRRHRRPSFPPPPPPSRSLPPVDDGAAVSSVRGPSGGAEGCMPQAGARGRRCLIRDVISFVASSSSAPSRSHSDHPGTGTRVRQSVLYSDRSSRSRHRRAAQAEEYTREEGSSELGRAVPVLPTIDAFSLSDPPLLTPQIETGERSDGDYDGAEHHPHGLGSSELNMALTDFPTDYDYDGVEEHPDEVSSSELGRTVKDLPPFERLSLSENTLFTPQPAEEIDDYYDELDGDGWSHCYSMRPKGVTRSMLLSLGDSILTTLPDMDQPRPDSDVDSEEYLREVQEYLDAFPCESLRESFGRLKEIEHATLTALAAEWGTEPPEPLEPPRETLTVDQEARPVQVPEQVSAVSARERQSVAPRESRPEASMEEVTPNGKTWMNKEVMLCFEKHVEKSAHLAGLRNYSLGELLHQCFSVESYNKVYHHYNFTVRMKMPISDDWVVELYFAEVKEMFGRKYYICYPLEPDENGCCYACRSQGVEELKHPAIGGFSKGSLAAPGGFGLWYTDE